MFYVILTLHLLAVAAKLGVLFFIPRLKDAEQARGFLVLYKRVDFWADAVLWVTGLGFFFVSSFDYLLQPWMIISMLIYVLVFYLTKRILLRGLRAVVDSGKIYAEKELKLLRTQNACVIVFILASLAGIGYLMVNKPF